MEVNKVYQEKIGEHLAEIHPQPKTGDNIQVFFKIYKDNRVVFSVWTKFSGTEARKLDDTKVYRILSEKGIERISSMIDNNEFEEGQEYKFIESVN